MKGKIVIDTPVAEHTTIYALPTGRLLRIAGIEYLKLSVSECLKLDRGSVTLCAIITCPAGEGYVLPVGTSLTITT